MSHKKAWGGEISNEEFSNSKRRCGRDRRVEMRDDITLQQPWCTLLMRQSTAVCRFIEPPKRIRSKGQVSVGLLDSSKNYFHFPELTFKSFSIPVYFNGSQHFSTLPLLFQSAIYFLNCLQKCEKKQLNQSNLINVDIRVW